MQRPLDDDQTLVERARERRGDLRPFEELVRRHEQKVLANCRYLAGSVEDAQDLAQEVFVKAYFGLGRFRGEASFGTWIQRIKVNHCLNFLRRRKGRDEVDVDDPLQEQHAELHVAPRAEAAAEDRDRRQRIAAALERMPETLRVALVLCDLDELPYQEIADELGIGLSATKMRIKRGREEFRRIYRDLEVER
jgi:RNA polymerase sigma-70 factor (ECF subfamily)